MAQELTEDNAKAYYDAFLTHNNGSPTGMFPVSSKALSLFTELLQLDATAMWVKPEASALLASIFVRPIPEEFVALGVYFISDPQLDEPESLILLRQLLICGARVFMTGTVEIGTYAASLMHSGNARMLRYAVHCTQEEMLCVASQNDFGRIIAYRSDYAPTQSVYDL